MSLEIEGNSIVDYVSRGVAHTIVTLPAGTATKQFFKKPYLFSIASPESEDKYLYIKVRKMYRSADTFTCLYFSLPGGAKIDEDFPGVRLVDISDYSSIWQFNSSGIMQHYRLIVPHMSAIDSTYQDFRYGRNDPGIIRIQIAVDDYSNYGAFFLDSDSIYKQFTYKSIEEMDIKPDHCSRGGSFFRQEYDSGTSDDSWR
jgi:hypothetical protein